MQRTQASLHADYSRFKDWFAKQKTKATILQGAYYRTAGPRYTSAEHIISGEGAMLANGRWIFKGMTRLVYLSREPETSLSESNAHARHYHLPFEMPKVTVAVKIILELVLDLSVAKNRRKMPETLKTLLAVDWRAANQTGEEALTQAVGRAAFSAGLQGLLVPSREAVKGVNLLVFPGNLSDRSVVKVMEPEKLIQLGKPT